MSEEVVGIKSSSRVVANRRAQSQPLSGREDLR